MENKTAAHVPIIGLLRSLEQQAARHRAYNKSDAHRVCSLARIITSRSYRFPLGVYYYVYHLMVSIRSHRDRSSKTPATTFSTVFTGEGGGSPEVLDLLRNQRQQIITEMTKKLIYIFNFMKLKLKLNYIKLNSTKLLLKHLCWAVHEHLQTG